jgi:uncharacterized protein YabN with tetrapyrrole methylase and pyrophosphatase domain
MELPEGFEGLVRIMDRLREPDGCPWDREQDYRTLRGFLLEECYEVADALDREAPAELREELGDLLFQIVFLSRLAKEQGHFTVEDVIEGITAKMIRRHPKAGRPERASALDGLPVALPALLGASRLGERAARVGFDWERPEAVVDKVEEELGELRSAMQAGDAAAMRDELGDLLFSVVNLARKLSVDPEAALATTNERFRQRFRGMERELARRGLSLEAAGLDVLEELWQAEKRPKG